MKNKNYLLHGATNCNSSNYGDFIYGDMIYTYLKSINGNVLFYQPSDFFKRYLKSYDDNVNFKKNQADLIVYIPGGYFGEGHNAKFKENIVQFLRFMPLGIWASFHKKNMIVLGVGAGPLNNIFMKYGVKKICNASKLVTVRDHESFECLKKISNNDQIFESSDLILTYDVQLQTDKSKQIIDILEKAKGKKIFIIHFNHDIVALKKFASAVNMFNLHNKDYYYVVTSDSVMINEFENISLFNDMVDFEFYHFKYNDPYELSTLLSISDVVLTCKLHVGVVSSLLKKSVIVVACHYEKTKRFYNQIGYGGRCINLFDSSVDNVFNLIEKNKDKKIIIPSSEINKAKLTLDLLNKYIGVDYNEK